MKNFEHKSPVEPSADALLDSINELDREHKNDPDYLERRQAILDKLKSNSVQAEYGHAEGLDQKHAVSKIDIETFLAEVDAEESKHHGLFSNEQVENIISQANTVDEIDHMIMEYLNWENEMIREGGLYDEGHQRKLNPEEATAQMHQVIEALREKKRKIQGI